MRKTVTRVRTNLKINKMKNIKITSLMLLLILISDLATAKKYCGRVRWGIYTGEICVGTGNDCSGVSHGVVTIDGVGTGCLISAKFELNFKTINLLLEDVKWNRSKDGYLQISSLNIKNDIDNQKENMDLEKELNSKKSKINTLKSINSFLIKNKVKLE